MSTSSSYGVVSRAFALMGDTPSPLKKALDAAADFESKTRVKLAEISKDLDEAPPDDALRILFHFRLAQWDASNDPVWGDGTAAQTQGRREVVYKKLDIGEAARQFQRLFPPYISESPEFTIATDDFKNWFNDDEQENSGFYWPRYSKYLQDTEGWPGPSVASLRRATAGVVERLAEPSRPDIYASRGLVVGYVQSGKTANFTGVIARAVDAGYRLIIVLGGITNILREQTQRRIDKQLIGKEALVGLAGAADEYRNAPDWDRFISYGTEPGNLGACDWIRLTTLVSDYKELGTGPGLAALEFERADETKPLFDPANLRRMRARLVVAKKNKAPLTALARDLARVQGAGIRVEDIPTLIIDDESDQASLNTRKPTKKEIKKRTAINEAIVSLLSILKRAQYVGYTATPAANVFADPNDKLSIFPRHFIKSLERPLGYMGASDYHDFGEIREGFTSNERAFVRPVYGADSVPENLQKALDCYILAGAIKLMRAKNGDAISGRHHTMLVHTSQKQDIHEKIARDIDRMFIEAGYYDGTANDRLETLLEADFRPVWQTRASGLTFPQSFDVCRTYIDQCIAKLESGPKRVLIVNGHKDHEAESPDFDRDSVWKVLVGGTKLSRGYTVEGLTVSYYRRAASAADTLMQMGRWFGFRRGYSDLMRLFIGRAEGAKPYDLYAAFEAICQDEMEFRKELLQYAKLPEDDEEHITPMRVPPLWTQHMTDLPVTDKNKRWNAYIQSQNYGGKGIAPTLAPKLLKHVKSNEDLARDLMKGVKLRSVILGRNDKPFDALAGFCTAEKMIAFLEKYRWLKDGVLLRQVNFLKGQLGDPEIDQWLVAWPVLTKQGEDGLWKLGEHEVTVIKRFRHPTGRFSVYTTPSHVDAANAIALGKDVENMTADTRALVAPRTGAALLYAAKASNAAERQASIGFYLLPPPNDIDEKVKWGVHAESQPDEPIVSVDAR